MAHASHDLDFYYHIFFSLFYFESSSAMIKLELSGP